MSVRRLCSSVIVLSLLCVAPALSQFHMAMAPVTGMNFNIHTGSDLESGGTGVGWVIGGQAIMTFSPTMGLVAGLTFYDNRSGSSSSSSPSKQYFNATANSDNSASLAYLQLEILPRFKVPKSDLAIIAGPVIGFNIEGSYDNKIKTVSNSDPSQFVEDRQKGSFKDLLVRFELKFGASYDIHVTKSLVVFPQVTFGYGLTKVVSDVSWRVLTIQALAGVKFNVM